MKEAVVKQTVAWIGEIDRRPEALRRLAERYRLLWVTEEEIPAGPPASGHPLPEVEVISCAKDGCWEADIIILTGEVIRQELLEKIREVSTQKVVMIITADAEEKVGPLSLIREVLPFSKIVEVILSPKETHLSGINPGAVATAREIVHLLGYPV